MTFNLSNYKQSQLLGAGQYQVYEYVCNDDSKNHKSVAVKEIFCKTFQKVKEAVNEAMIQFRCNHKYLLKCLGYEQIEYENGGIMCQIVMEKMDMSLSNQIKILYLYLCQGQFILQKAKTNQPFTLKEFYSIIGNLLSAMAYLEELLICHRDIKSDNIFIRFKQTGFDTIIGDVGGSTLSSTQEKKMKGQLIYTDSYKSPEINDIVKSGSQDFLLNYLIYNSSQSKQMDLINWTISDIYSLGIVFLEIATSQTIKISGKQQQEFIQSSLSIVKEKYGNDIHQLITKMLINNPNQRPSPKDLCTFVQTRFQGQIKIEIEKGATLGQIQAINPTRDNFQEMFFQKIQQELHCIEHPQENITQICLTCFENPNSIQKFVCTQCLSKHKLHKLESLVQFLSDLQSNKDTKKQDDYINICNQIQDNTLQKQQFIQCWNDYFKNLINEIQQKQQNLLKEQLNNFELREKQLEEDAKKIEERKTETSNPLKQYHDKTNINEFTDDQKRELFKFLTERYEQKKHMQVATVYKQNKKYGESLISQLKLKKPQKIISIVENELNLSHQYYEELSCAGISENFEESKQSQPSGKIPNKFTNFAQNYPRDPQPQRKEKKLIRKN